MRCLCELTATVVGRRVVATRLQLRLCFPWLSSWSAAAALPAPAAGEGHGAMRGPQRWTGPFLSRCLAWSIRDSGHTAEGAGFVRTRDQVAGGGHAQPATWRERRFSSRPLMGVSASVLAAVGRVHNYLATATGIGLGILARPTGFS